LNLGALEFGSWSGKRANVLALVRPGSLELVEHFSQLRLDLL
jgi:hypothetical protein